jgi:alpha-tubulin suppressor-like RCC1 family protein
MTMRSIGSFSSLLLVAACFLLVAVAAFTSLAGASPSERLAGAGTKISAHLTKASFAPAQAGSVKLIYKLSKPSKSFGYTLSLKKGAKWQTVNAVKEKGTFKGSRSMTVKKLFAGKPVKPGSYRLKLFGDEWSQLLTFKVTGLLTGIQQISLGLLHTCALLSGGKVDCWGVNGYGELGSGTSAKFLLTPLRVHGIADAAAISAAGYYTCALISGGAIECWGGNGYGQLGDGITDHDHNGSVADDFSPAPVRVKGIDHAVAVSTGNDHACALISGGTVECWGGNTAGELGDGIADHGHGSSDWDEGDFSPTPVKVVGITSAVAVTAAYGTSCALLKDGTIDCWGTDNYGELGSGAAASSSVPVTVAGISGAKAVSAGTFFVCALISDGTIECWGGNSLGQLGNGTLSPYSAPSPVLGIEGSASQVSAGNYEACALIFGGTMIACWGANSGGSLGDGVKSHGHTEEGVDFSLTPVLVSGITRALEVSTGIFNACAVLSDHTAVCWGRNPFGELGDGTKRNHSTPVPVIAGGGS